MKADNQTVATLLKPHFRALFQAAIEKNYSQVSFIEASDSVVTAGSSGANSAGSLVRRERASILTRLYRFLSGPASGVTRRNAAKLSILLHSKPDPILLVVGGGTIGNGVETLYADPSLRIVAFDIYASEHTHFVADAHSIPIEDATCDAVLIQAVLEHVVNPMQVVAEIRRVLKPSGLVYAETPFMQQVHEGPYDFTRFTHSGHRWLFKEFDELSSGVTTGVGTQLLWSIDYLVRGVSRSRAIGRIARLLFFWVRFFDLLVPARYNIDGASGCFFLGSKGGGLSIDALIAYYRGSQK